MFPNPASCSLNRPEVRAFDTSCEIRRRARAARRMYNVTLDLSLFRDMPTIFVELEFGSDAEMTPRFRLATVPYAAY